jgi:hypothetical protein
LFRIVIFGFHGPDLKDVGHTDLRSKLGRSSNMVWCVNEEPNEYIHGLVISACFWIREKSVEFLEISEPVRHVEGYISRLLIVQFQFVLAEIDDSFLDGSVIHLAFLNAGITDVVERSVTTLGVCSCSRPDLLLSQRRKDRGETGRQDQRDRQDSIYPVNPVILSALPPSSSAPLRLCASQFFLS